MRAFTLILSSTFLLLAGTAFAQDAEQTSGRKVKYKERTEISFDDLSVDGEIVKPRLIATTTTKNIKFDVMLPIRKNFSKELKQTVEEVK